MKNSNFCELLSVRTVTSDTICQLFGWIFSGQGKKDTVVEGFWIGWEVMLDNLVKVSVGKKEMLCLVNNGFDG